MVDYFAAYKQRTVSGYVAPVSSDPVGRSDVVQPQEPVAGVVYDPADPVVQGYSQFNQSAFGVIRDVGDVSSYQPITSEGSVVPKRLENWNESDVAALQSSQILGSLPLEERLAIAKSGFVDDVAETSSFEIRGGSGGALWGWMGTPIMKYDQFIEVRD